MSDVNRQGATLAGQGQLRCVDGSRPRLLLAEDSGTVRALTAALLKRMGCMVDAVEHGEEAVEHVRHHTYDLVVLDIEMPVMDGISAAHEIRALGGEPARTPILAFSAFLADTLGGSRSIDPFDATLAKPAGGGELRSAIQRVLQTHPYRA